MLTPQEISDLIEKITRRFEVELPLEFEDFQYKNEGLYICFKKSEANSSFELSKGITIEFDSDSRIIGLRIESSSNLLPRNL